MNQTSQLTVITSPPPGLLNICGEGESYVLCGKRPGHVDDGDNLHHDINLSIEWPAGQSPLRRI